MTILKKTKMLVSFLVPFGLSEEASASFALGQNHGIGMYPAQAQCPYPSEMADEIAGLEADRRDTRDRLSEIKRELRRAKRRLSEAEKRVDAEKTKFQNSGLTGTAYNTIDNHISGKLRCSGYETERCRPREVDYRRRSPPRDRSGSGAPAEASIDRIDPVEALLALNGFGEVSATRNVATETRPPSGLDDAEPDSGPRVPRERTECPGGLRPVDPFTPNVWARACRGSQLSGSICRDAPDAFRAEKFNIRACERSLVDWYKKNAELNAANDEVNQLQAELDSLDSDEKELKKEIREAKRDASEERRRMISEGGFESIMQGSVSRGPQRTGPNLVEIGGNVIFGLASMYFGQQQQRFISDNNAKLGFATQTHPSWGYGWPYFGNALYGATQGGMSSGSFGCSTGFGNGGGSGGVFGYPPGMMGGPQSGGLFNNGFGPGGYGVPMNGMTGLPYGYLGNAGMGFQMNGPVPGMGYGAPMMGYQMGGPVPGLGYGAPLNGMPYGYAANAGIGFQMGGPMVGAPMVGAPMMGTYLGGPMSGLPGGGALDPSTLQLQQMQMQLQMQQYQSMMQMQQRRMENYMAQSRVVTGLSMELSTLYQRLQQAQLSMQTGGSLGFENGGYGNMGLTTPGYAPSYISTPLFQGGGVGGGPPAPVLNR